MNDHTNRTGALVAAGGVPRARDDGAPEAETDETLDATVAMTAEEWLEHALGDLHSSAWTTPAVEL